MTPIRSTLPAQLAPEAQTNKTDGDGAQKPADCFSILLQTLITPFAAPSPLPAQTATFEASVNSAPQTLESPDAKPARADAEDQKREADDATTMPPSLINLFVPQQTLCPLQAETTTVNISAVETETDSPTANVQPRSQTIFAGHSLQPDVVADAARGGALKPDTIFEKPSFEERAGRFEKLPAMQSTPAEKSATLRVPELEPSNNSASAGRDHSELSPAPTTQTSAALNQPIISVEQHRTFDSLSWPKQQLFDTSFSPSRKPLAVIAAAVEGLRDADESLPPEQSEMAEAAESVRLERRPLNPNLPATPAPRASFAATLDRLRVTSESQFNLNSQPEKQEMKTDDASPPTQATAEQQPELAQTNVSAETVAQSVTPHAMTKDSIAMEATTKNPEKSDNPLTREAQFSPEAAQASMLQRAGETVQTIKTTQSVATQVGHAMTQLADAVFARREPQAIRIRLRPEELGEVEIRITTDDRGHLNAHISAEQDFTRRAIEGGLNHLRETMQEAGVNISEISVSISQLTSGGAGAHTESNSETATAQRLVTSQTSPSSDENAGESNEDRLLSVRA